MALMTIRKRLGTTANLPPITQLAGLAAKVFLFLLFVLFFGGIAALFPASFVVKLGFLIGGAVVFVLALLLPAGARAPRVLLRRLLFALLVIWVAWPVYLSYRGLPGPGINPTRLIYWSLTGLWFFWFVGSQELRDRLSVRIVTFRPFLLLLLSYLVWGLICAGFSKAPFFSMYYLIKLMIGPVLVFLVALSCLRDRRDVDFALMLMVFAALIASAIGMLEAFRKANLFYDLVPALFPKGDDGESFWTEQLVRDKSRGGDYRVMSTFTHPLTFGEYLALSLPLAVYLVGFASQPWHRLLGLITIPSMVVGLYIAHTRSPLLAAGVVIVGLAGFFGVRAMRQKRKFAISATGFFALVTVFLAAVWLMGVAMELAAGRNTAETSATLARIIMFQRGSILVLDQPIIGYGPGLAANTLGFLPGITILTIDSYYLSVALESGLPGLSLFLGLLGYPVIKGLLAGMRMPGQAGARIAVITLALLGFSVVKLVLSLTENFDAFFLLIALLAISLEPESTHPLVERKSLQAKRALELQATGH